MFAAELIHYCDDCERYHLALFDYDENGKLMQGDTDGNWDCCSGIQDLPSLEETKAGKQAYLKEVAKTGNDYLYQLIVKASQKVTWQVRFRSWIGSNRYGILFDGARKASSGKGRGEWITDLDKLPDYLIEYLDLHKPETANLRQLVFCPAFESIKQLRVGALEVKFQREKHPDLLARFIVALDEPLDEATLIRRTKKAAKQALARIEA